MRRQKRKAGSALTVITLRTIIRCFMYFFLIHIIYFSQPIVFALDNIAFRTLSRFVRAFENSGSS